jgi:antitoxin component of MazEF toxin-antitoxin module
LGQEKDMAKAQLQEVNGTLMLAVPPLLIERMRLSAGSEIEVEMQDDSLKLEKVSRRGRVRLDDLLNYVRSAGV